MARLGGMAETGHFPKCSFLHSTRLSADHIRYFDLNCHNDLEKPHYLFCLVEIKYNCSMIFKWSLWLIKPSYL